MNDKIIVKYMGFKPMSLTREYTFHVSADGADREFRLKITNDAFVSHRARYQDAPAICSERLQAELAAHSNHPPTTEYEITAAELRAYMERRNPKISRGLSGWKKAQQDF
jgi:hypothetical protein